MADAAPRAFVSYARSDAAFVLKVAQQLRLQGCKVWVDQLDIPKGARWDEAVEGALRASACLMVVLSPASVQSQNVLDEVAFALDEKRPVLPILLQPVAVPFRLKRLQYIDFTGDYAAAFEQLAAALDVQAQALAHDAPARAAAAPAAGERIAAAPPPAEEPPAPAPPPRPAPAPPLAAPTAPAAGTAASAQPSVAITAPAPAARRRPLGLMAAAAAGLVVLAYVLLMRNPPPREAPPVAAAPAAAPAAVPDAAAPAAPRREAAAPGAAAPVVPAAAAPVLDDQRIRGFVADYIAALNRVDAGGLMAFYAERVDYFDYPGVGHDFILKDKQAFHRRWPVIENRLASDIAVDRSAGDGSVSVSYTIRYRVSSPQRADAESGAARDVLVLRLIQDRPLIVAQRQQPLGERAAN